MTSRVGSGSSVIVGRGVWPSQIRETSCTSTLHFLLGRAGRSRRSGGYPDPSMQMLEAWLIHADCDQTQCSSRAKPTQPQEAGLTHSCQQADREYLVHESEWARCESLSTAGRDCHSEVSETFLRDWALFAAKGCYKIKRAALLRGLGHGLVNRGQKSRPLH